MFAAAAFFLIAESRVLEELATIAELTDPVARFESYKQQFNKNYQSVREHEQRLIAFLESESEIDRLNAMEGDAVFGWTEFSDMTKDEFKAMLGYSHPAEALDLEVGSHGNKTLKLSGSLDWRDEGLVTPVKDQGGCGSCWAFSATETVESAYLKANPKTDATEFALSAQQIVSCDRDGVYGCEGGFLPSAFKYVSQAGGMASEANYPYTSGGGSTGSCHDYFKVVPGTEVTSWKYATDPCTSGSCNNQDENQMGQTMQAVGPLGICVDATNWQNYQGGVMSDSTCGSHSAYSLDHCVQAVGYKNVGGSDGKGYWIVRNSWNTWWGEKGYIYLEYGSNTCGIANGAMYVTV